MATPIPTATAHLYITASSATSSTSLRDHPVPCQIERLREEVQVDVDVERRRQDGVIAAALQTSETLLQQRGAAVVAVGRLVLTDRLYARVGERVESELQRLREVVDHTTKELQ